MRKILACTGLLALLLISTIAVSINAAPKTGLRFDPINPYYGNLITCEFEVYGATSAPSHTLQIEAIDCGSNNMTLSPTTFMSNSNGDFYKKITWCGNPVPNPPNDFLSIMITDLDTEEVKSQIVYLTKKCPCNMRPPNPKDQKHTGEPPKVQEKAKTQEKQ